MSVTDLLPDLDHAEGLSPIEQLVARMVDTGDPGVRQAIEDLTEEACEQLLHDWSFLGRPKQQLPPGEWDTWMIMAGRGWGKTRTGAEGVREWWRRREFGYSVGLIGRTPTEIRDVMIEGESGLLRIHPPSEMPVYEPSKMRLTWPDGRVAHIRSAQEPDSVRGLNVEKAWVDEPAMYRALREVWDNLGFALRLGPSPQAILTTTPRPKKVLREILMEPGTVLTRGTTYENVQNLARRFLRRILGLYEGTRVGRQELHAELLMEAEGALWTRALLDQSRVHPSKVPPLARVVTALDPSDGDEESDEQAIAVAALGLDHRYYVFWVEGTRLSPGKWLQRAMALRRHYGGDRLVAEKNHGGAWIESTLRLLPDGRDEPYKTVSASEGKRTRAEPIAALYEQDRVRHVGVMIRTPEGPVCTWKHFDDLEDQQTSFLGLPGEKSPDRLDALVWALHELKSGAAVGLPDPDAHSLPGGGQFGTPIMDEKATPF